MLFVLLIFLTQTMKLNKCLKPLVSRFHSQIAESNQLVIIIADQNNFKMAQCIQQLCRGGIACCMEDSTLNVAYCVTETYCNPNSATAGVIVLLVLLLLATLGIAIALYCRWKSQAPRILTMINFVQRQLYLFVYPDDSSPRKNTNTQN